MESQRASAAAVARRRVGSVAAAAEAPVVVNGVEVGDAAAGHDDHEADAAEPEHGHADDELEDEAPAPDENVRHAAPPPPTLTWRLRFVQMARSAKINTIIVHGPKKCKVLLAVQ